MATQRSLRGHHWTLIVIIAILVALAMIFWSRRVASTTDAQIVQSSGSLAIADVGFSQCHVKALASIPP